MAHQIKSQYILRYNRISKEIKEKIYSKKCNQEIAWNKVFIPGNLL